MAAKKYEKILCAKCSKQIQGKYMIMEGENYHTECMSCENCKGSLEKLADLYCVDCQQEIHEAEVYPINGKLYCYDCHWSGKLKAERARDKDSRNQDDRRYNKESQNQDSQRKRGKKDDRK